MSEHVICNKEADIAVMRSDITGIKSDMSEIKHAILGNGQPGIKTELAKQGQVISALVWFVGVCLTAIVGVVSTLIIQAKVSHP